MLRKLVLIVAEAVAIVLIWILLAPVVAEIARVKPPDSVITVEAIEIQTPYPYWTLIVLEPDSTFISDSGQLRGTQSSEYACLVDTKRMWRYHDGDWARVYLPSAKELGFVLLKSASFTSEVCSPLSPAPIEGG